MDETNNSQNDIYYNLYKKVFGNVFLAKLIFEKVYELNYNQLVILYKLQPLTNSYKNDFNNNMDTLINKKYKYLNIPYNVIFQFGLVSIFKDRIKTKTKSNTTISSLLLSKFLGEYNNNDNDNNQNKQIIISKEEIESFYFLNKEMILNLKNDNDNNYNNNNNNINKSKKFEKRRDLFEMLVENKQVEFLKIIYNDQIDFIKKEKEKYYCEKRKMYLDYGNNIIPDSIDFITEWWEFKKVPFLVYANFQLVKTALQYSSIKVLQFLKEIEVDFNHYQNNLLYWSLLNENRIELVNWLFDELYLKIPKFYYGIYPLDVYDHILKLDYKTFKRAVKKGLPISTNSFNLNFPNCVTSNSPFNKQIDLILISIHSTLEFTKSIEYMVILKIIKQLLKYDKNPSDNLKITPNSISLIFEKVYYKYKYYKQYFIIPPSSQQQQQQQQNQKDGGFSILDSIYSLFYKNNNSSMDHNTNNKKTILNEKQIPKTLSEFKNANSHYIIDYITEFSNIDYNEFNLEREIKRIFILEFLNTKNNLFINSLFKTSIIYFIVRFDCFKLLDNFIQKHYSPRIEEEIINQILFTSNYNSYIYYKKNKLFKPNYQNSITDYQIRHIFSKKNIKFYIELLSVMCEYNDINFGLIFYKVLLGIKEEDISDSIEKMKIILKEYQKVNENHNFRLQITLLLH